MTLDELRRLDPNRVGSWPLGARLGALGIALFLTVAGAWWFDWQNQIELIQAEQDKEEQLRNTFLEKKKLALDLPAYRKQLDDIDKQFGALLKQLPGKSEMDALLTDVNQAGLGRGLQFELFKPAAQETVKDFYAELPITIDDKTLVQALFDADGTAIVVHASADDYKTDPSGNSGARIACGVVKLNR